MIVLVVKLEVVEGKKAEFIEIAKQIVAGSQLEAGNIEYNLYEELDEPNTVTFIEKWQDQAAIDLHEKMDHFANNIGKLRGLLAKPPVRNRYDVVK